MNHDVLKPMYSNIVLIMSLEEKSISNLSKHGEILGDN